uniref:Uncharacterized protein n=1 Tax=viral metagenome TaxID=1070528 RepID=A0A6C0B3B5_9ZZZZ
MKKYIFKVKVIYIYTCDYKMTEMDERQEFLISMYNADIYNDLLDYMDYKNQSELLMNLNAGDISKFFSQFLTFKIPKEEEFIENDTDDEYI